MNKDAEITDARDAKEFRLVTINGYKKTEVKRELIKSLMDSNIEPACYWSAQLICSGNLVDLWDTIITFYTKHVHLSNPVLALYFEKRIGNFKDVVKNGRIEREIDLRNNMHIRIIFAEMITILARATKRPKLEEVKVHPEYFDVTNITTKLRAPDVSYAKIVFVEEDPKEVYIAINELSYTLTSKSRDTMLGCFWVEWIMEYKRIRAVKKQPCHCVRRYTDLIDEKHQRNVDWLVWELFVKIGEKNSDKRVGNIIKSLRSLYILKYSGSGYKKRRYVMYMAIYVLMENCSINNTQMIDDNTKIEIKHVCANINNVYKQIKERESLPVDKVMNSVPERTTTKQEDKIHMMNEIASLVIPRI